MSSFTARVRSTCVNCFNSIDAGDIVIVVDGIEKHVKCPPVIPEELRPIYHYVDFNNQPHDSKKQWIR